MKIHIQAVLFLLGFLVFLAVPGFGRPQTLEIKEGSPFPLVPLPTVDGKWGTLQQFRNNKTLLHIFASW